MKKIVFATLATLGMLLGAANIVTLAHASTNSFALPNQNEGNGS
jgi:hypothetical protein